MYYPTEQIAELKMELGTEVREIEEGGYVYIYIPDLKLPPSCSPQKVEAILCPQPHSGYTSRLFFKEQIQTPKAVNWNGQVFILGHQWYAFSYNNVQNMTMLNMVMNHLRGMVV